MNLDSPNSRIYSDISLCGRFLTITTENEINIFPLPAISVFSNPNLSVKFLDPICDVEENGNNLENNGNFKSKYLQVKSMKIIMKDKNKDQNVSTSTGGKPGAGAVAAMIPNKSSTENNENDAISVNGDYLASVIIAVNISEIINIPEITPEVPAIVPKPGGSPKKSTGNLKNGLQGANVISVSSKSVEKISVNLQIAIFNRFSLQWVIVDGSFICNKIMDKNIDKNSIKIIEKNLDKNNDKNNDKKKIDFYVDSSELKEEFEVSILKSWKLPTFVTVFQFLENRNLVAVGFNNGKIDITIFSLLLFLCNIVFLLFG